MHATHIAQNNGKVMISYFKNMWKLKYTTEILNFDNWNAKTTASVWKTNKTKNELLVLQS